jgi:hypothetical protein
LNFGNADTITEVLIIDATGKVLISKQMNGSSQIDISSLANGSYIAKIITAQGNQVKLVSKF